MSKKRDFGDIKFGLLIIFLYSMIVVITITFLILYKDIDFKLNNIKDEKQEKTKLDRMP